MKKKIITLVATLGIIAGTGFIAPASAGILEDLADEACVFYLPQDHPEYFRCYHDIMDRLSAAEPAPGAAEERIEEACRYYDREYPGYYSRCMANYSKHFLSGGN